MVGQVLVLKAGCLIGQLSWARAGSETAEVVVRLAAQQVGLISGLVHEGCLDGSGDRGMAEKQITGLIWWMQRWLAQ